MDARKRELFVPGSGPSRAPNHVPRVNPGSGHRPLPQAGWYTPEKAQLMGNVGAMPPVPSVPPASSSAYPIPVPMAQNPHVLASEDANISMSEESASEDSQVEGSEYTSDGESDAGFAQAKSHPYYEQWKQYYRALELQKQRGAMGPQKPQSQPAPLRNLYPGLGPSLAPPQTAPSERFYNIVQTADADSSSLVQNSRRDTLKSTRSASVPPEDHGKHAPKTRAISVNAASPAGPVNSNLDVEYETTQSKENVGNDESFDKFTPLEPAKMRPPQSRNISSALVASRLRQLSVNTTGTQISDYGAFVVSDSDSDNDNDNDNEHDHDNDESTLNTRDGAEAMYDQEQKQTQTQIEPQMHNPPPSESLQNLYAVVDAYQEPAQIGGAEPEDSGLNRNTSSASTNSYNSLQSEKNFSVGPSLRRVATPSSKTHRKPRALSQSRKFTPPIAGPPPPITPMAPVSNGQEFELQRQLSYIKRQSTGSLPMSDMYMQQIQQQIQQLQQLQQMQQFQQFQHMNMGMNSPGGSVPRSSDSFINRKIDEFVELRKVIAAGNKTFEYRLKWLKMLISATNNKLYAYINIKGEGIPTEQVGDNKQHFIRSSVNHLHKLVKELAGSQRKESQRLYAEACYFQGCFYLNAYLERYGQDFNYQLNVPEAENFFHECLDNNPGYFRAYYELGELYELQQEEDKFDLALQNYTESAKMGYNRAIYKVALIQLLVPKARLTRFFSYFKKLADIDMESSDVQLSGADRDELEEIVGLAQFQLGKIYEGIYPGDLTADDEFVQASLEIAPVIYSKSLSYYNKSAKLSCVQAQVRLGRIYEDGELNRGYNPKKSVQWYIKASSSPLKYKRHPEAMLGLSRWFLKGTEGLSKYIPYPDPEKAVEWCERACKEFMYPEAFYQMGLLVEQGYAAGNATEWFELAWRAGHSAAGEHLGMANA